MDQSTLVDLQIRDGQRLVDRLARSGILVTTACWLKESDSGQWFLYIATPLVDADGATRPAYRRLNAVIREMQKEDFAIDPFEVKVIGTEDPIAKAAIAARDLRPGRLMTRIGGRLLGAVAIDEAYIYPPRRIFVLENRRRGQTTHWDALRPGLFMRSDPNDLWADGDVRIEQQGNRLIIRVCSDDAVQEQDASIAEELAKIEVEKQFPEFTIHYSSDSITP